MNILKKSLISMAVLMPSFAMADDCQMAIGYANVSQGENVPASIDARLEAKLTRLLAQSGISTSDPLSRFFVTGRFDHAYSDVISTGSRTRQVINTELTLYIGDNETQQVYASCVFSLKGIGDTPEQAFNKCVNGLSKTDKRLVDFLNEGRDKIVNYYNSQYSQILAKARAAVANRNYDEALYYSTSIPECCVGYDQAIALTREIYKSYTDFDGENLLAKARGEWAADPTDAGARKAFSYLSQIDPSAACAPQARALGDQISKTVQKQWEFENIQKHKDAIALEKARINAARDVAVAYAKSRPKVVHHYHWLW